MRITVTAASRRDEILQRKADYESKKARNKAIEDEQSRRYRKAQVDVFSKVEEAIRQELGDTAGNLNIQIDVHFGQGMKVEIKNNEGWPVKHDNTALSWSWGAYLNRDGEVAKESSSWSGLEATTLAQIEDLKQSVRQLEIINSMDWKELLDVTLPNWSDYATGEGIEDIGPRPNFEQELIEADIADAIGQNVLIKGKEGRAWRGDVYFKINRDSGSQYTVTELPARYVDQIVNQGSVEYGKVISSIDELVGAMRSEFRVRKVNFVNMIYTPVQIVEF